MSVSTTDPALRTPMLISVWTSPAVARSPRWTFGQPDLGMDRGIEFLGADATTVSWPIPSSVGDANGLFDRFGLIEHPQHVMGDVSA
jgi:hypothetical protein